MYLAIIIIGFLYSGCTSVNVANHETASFRAPASWRERAVFDVTRFRGCALRVEEYLYNRDEAHPDNNRLEINCRDGRRKVTSGSEAYLVGEWALRTAVYRTVEDMALTYCASDSAIFEALKGRVVDEIVFLRDSEVGPSENQRRGAIKVLPGSSTERAAAVRELAFDETAYVRLVPSSNFPADTVYLRVSRAVNGGENLGPKDAAFIRVREGEALPDNVEMFRP